MFLRGACVLGVLASLAAYVWLFANKPSGGVQVWNGYRHDIQKK